MNDNPTSDRQPVAVHGEAPVASGCPCESVWQCRRGRTHLVCELRTEQNCYRVNLVRNSRVYGAYQFAARQAALTFAGRLRSTFAGNGWDEVDRSVSVA
ncbi:MAG: hypothetical protein AB7H96_05010 [Vicinamibacterales bacterium]